MENFKAIVDDSFRGAPLNIRQNKAAAILSEDHKLSRIAQGWGNKSAANWCEDKGFIQYLTVVNLPKWEITG